MTSKKVRGSVGALLINLSYFQTTVDGFQHGVISVKRFPSYDILRQLHRWTSPQTSRLLTQCIITTVITPTLASVEHNYRSRYTKSGLSLCRTPKKPESPNRNSFFGYSKNPKRRASLSLGKGGRRASKIYCPCQSWGVRGHSVRLRFRLRL